MTIAKVGVIGCGLMGSGIAESCARAGLDVVVYDFEDALATGRERIGASMNKAVRNEKMTEEERDDAEVHLNFSSRFELLADRQIVIEAASEQLDVKLDLFRRLSATVDDDNAILASNTSSIPIAKLAHATARPEHVIGLHFFNPVPVMDIVEVIRADTTSDDTFARVRTFAEEQLHKRVVLGPDEPGFIVNALLIPYLLSAIRMFEAGKATAEDIDVAMEKGCAHPMGPLRLSDFIGLDTVLSIAEVINADVPDVLRRMVADGNLGRKSGQGFYAY